MSVQAQLLGTVETRMKYEGRSMLASARAGDEQAFHAIFNQFSKPILSFIFHMLGDRDHAEELTQETFVRAYRNLGTMRDETQLSAWLFGIARNVVREAVKEKYKNQRKIGLDEAASLGIADGRPTLDEGLITTELEQAVHRALANLSSDHRLVFVLKVFKEKSYEEIARITGSSVAKLKTDLHRARLEMKNKLRPYLWRVGPFPSR